MKKRFNIKIVLQCIIFAVICCCCSTALHAFRSAFIEGVHGKPSFVSNALIFYSFYAKLSFAIVYVLVGHLIPVKNKVLRGFIYMALVWGSNFIPQIMGLACADGEIAKEAFSVSIVLCDSIGYLIDALIIGIIIKIPCDAKSKPCSLKSLLKTSFISMVTFPILVIAINSILEMINEELGGRVAMGVSKEHAVPFYICFYACFLITGFLLPLFYRITLYNTEKLRASLIFSLIYAIGIWTPVVLIMIAFGTAILPTFMYCIGFLIVILVSTYLNGLLLNQFEKEK